MKEKINYLTLAGVILILIVLVFFYYDWRSSRNFSSQPTDTIQEKTSAGILKNIFSTSPQVKKAPRAFVTKKAFRSIMIELKSTPRIIPFKNVWIAVAGCL